jgi:hypothetical protein
VNIPGTRRFVLATAIALSAFGTAMAAVTAAQAAPSASAGPSAGAAKPVIVNCVNKAQIKPSTFTITCADGNNYLKSLAWSSWAAHTATGKGTDEINSCVPACFDGKFHAYPAKVLLWRPRARPGHAGQEYFTRMTLTYTKKVPKGSHRVQTIDLWAKGA